MSEPADLGVLLRRYHDSGDEAAVEEIVRRTRSRLLRVARRIGSPQDAEDAVQSAYLALARRRGEPFTAPVLPWLITAVVRIAYRRKAIEKRQHDLAGRLSTEQRVPSAAAAAIGAEDRRLVRGDVARLPRKYRDAIVLHYLEGLTVPEVARLLELPEATARTHVRRGRELLRGRLHITWLSAILILPWLVQGALAGLMGGLVMKKKAVVVGGLLLLTLTTGVIVLETLTARSGDTEHAEKRRQHAEAQPLVSRPGETADGAAAPSSGPHVTGLVLDEEGRPVAGARVGSMARSARRPTARALSDDKGRFRIALAGEAPHHRLWVEAKGFSPALLEPVRSGQDVQVTLDETSTLGGTVFDLDGNPVAGARVRWFALAAQVHIERVAVSDDEGRYLIDGLPSPWGLAEQPLSGFAAAVLVKADGFATLITQAEMPSARSGRDLAADLFLARGATVRGRVLDAHTGRPLAGARVVLGSMPGAPLPITYGESITAGDGTFRLDQVACDGFHQIAGYASGSDRIIGVLRTERAGYAAAADDVPVAREGETVQVDVRCWPTGAVRGRVVDGKGRPLAEVAVSAFSFVQPRRSTLDAAGSQLETRTDPDGRYELAPPAPGRLEISARRAGWPGQLIQVEVGLDGVTKAPDLELAGPEHPSAMIEVVDAAGSPVWDASVSLRPGGGFFRTGRDGRVRVYQANGGEVRAVASSAESAQRWSEPFALALRSDVVVRIVLDATHTIEGLVRLADGSPAPGARVDARSEQGGNLTMAGRDGRFRLRRLPEGRFAVSAHYWDSRGSYVHEAVSEVPADSRAVVIALPPFKAVGTVPTVTLEGRVLDSVANKPVWIFGAALTNGQRILSAKREPGGRFRFTGVSEGRWSLSVSSTGYGSYRQSGIEVRLGTRHAPLEVRLSKGAQVSGKVQAQKGIDLSRVFVGLQRRDGFMTEAHYLRRGVAYTLEGVPPGTYRPVFLNRMDIAPAADAVVVVPDAAGRIRFDFKAVPGGRLSLSWRSAARAIEVLDAAGRTIWTRDGLKQRTWWATTLPVGEYSVRLHRLDAQPLDRACTVRTGESTKVALEQG